MQITRLEVFGFKSFMERLIFPLGNGITAVVGPNGCGKSNIVDALRWVLGETRASQLRGDVLEDVIFNGSEKQRPLGIAEVTMVVRAQGSSLYDDVAEAIRRYDLPTELLETLETAAKLPLEPANDNQVAGEAAVAQQAEVTPIRPVANDDVKPEATEANAPSQKGDIVAGTLSKYAWLKSISEMQITRRLYRSGESEFFINKVQCRLKDIRDLIRVMGLGARSYSIIAQGEIGRIISAKPEERRLIIEEAAQIAGFREHITATNKRLTEVSASLARLDDVIAEAGRQVQSLKRQASRALARGELKTELSASERRLFADSYVRGQEKLKVSKEQHIENAEAERKLEEQYNEARKQEEGNREVQSRLDQEVDAIRSKVDGFKETFSQRERAKAQLSSRIEQLRSLINAKRNEITHHDERRGVLAGRLKDTNERVQQLSAQEQELRAQLANDGNTGEPIDLDGITASLQNLRREFSQQNSTFQKSRDRLVAAESRLEALKSHAVRSNNSPKSNKPVLSPELMQDLRLYIDGLKIPAEFSVATQAVLLEHASSLVSNSPESIAKALAEPQRKDEAERFRKSGIGILRSGSWSEGREGVSLPAVEGIQLVSLASVVESAEWCAGVSSHFFRNVYVADSLEQAVRYFEICSEQGLQKSTDGLRLVTRQGEVISSWGFYSVSKEGSPIQLKLATEEAAANIEVARVEFEAAAKAKEELSSKISVEEQRHSDAVKTVQQNQARARKISSQHGEVRGRHETELRLQKQLENDLSRIDPLIGEIQRQVESLQSEVQTFAANLEALNSEDDAEVRAQLAEATQELALKEQERRNLRNMIQETLRATENCHRALQAAQTRGREFALNVQRTEIFMERLKEDVLREYGEDLWTEITATKGEEALIEQNERIALDDRIKAIRARIQREGDVDPTSIEQYEVEHQRHNTMLEQRADLAKAMATLQDTLKRLVDASQERFVSTFHSIKSNFSKFAPRLFGGGSSDIVLLNPENPLESGVEIVVRPPGKKLKSIDLMSGGEKALSATALVFSIFMVRPSPLCVLDEVDAPLDEANVQRFLDFVKDMSATTQFLMITHNKASMTAADTLVGVTMQEPGVSKVLSVTLQEAISQAA